MNKIGAYRPPEAYAGQIAEMAKLLKRYKFKEALTIFNDLPGAL